MNKKLVYSSLSAVAIYLGIRVWRVFKQMSIKRRLEKEKKALEKIMAEVLFFQSGACEKHLFTKELCYNMDCPIKKLWFIMDTLNSSRKSLDICIHLLTSGEIANSLLECHKRGVKVRVICDNEMSTNKGSQIRNLTRAGIAVKIPLLNYHMHCKIAIIDGWKVMTGSANWTVQGIHGNWDNLIVTSHPDIARETAASFELMWNNPKIQMFC